MEIKLAAKRHLAGTLFLGIVVLITFIIFLVGFVTIAARAKKLRPRQLPDEDTNAVNHIQVEWYGRVAPTYQEPASVSARRARDPQPGSDRGSRAPSRQGQVSKWVRPSVLGSSAPLLTLSFPWQPGLETNGWVSILRTEDLLPPVQWTVLHYVWFGDQWVTNAVGTNIFLTIEFLDQYAPPGQAFYLGLVLTNR